MLGAWAALRLLNDIGTLLFNTHFIVRTGAAESKAARETHTRVVNAWQQLTRGRPAAPPHAAIQLPHSRALFYRLGAVLARIIIILIHC